MIVPTLLEALALALAALADGTTATAGPVKLRGKVVPLAKALADKGIKADPEPIAGQVALVTEAGEVVPLLSDEASRAFFQDERLRDRKTEVDGLRRADVPYLQVVNVKVDENGAMRTPEYYCEVCAIHVRYPQTCPCCQGPMVLQFKPEGQ